MQDRTIVLAVYEFVHEAPRLFDHVPSGKKRLIPVQKVGDDTLVRLGRGFFLKKFGFRGTKRTLPHPSFYVELHADALPRGNFENDAVRDGTAVLVEQDRRGFFEYDDDPRTLRVERFSGPEVHGHPFEAPIMDFQPEGGIGFRTGLRIHSGFTSVSFVLPEHHVGGDIFSEPERADDLGLFVVEGLSG